jgi:multicomponent Na+:H+ antiporter subunit G
VNVILDGATAILVVTGLAFFVAGTVGLLRFPDVFTRLHALTKADNAGLGCIVLGLCLQASSVREVLVLLAVWLLVLLSGVTGCQLIAGRARASGITPWSAQ